MRLGPTAARVLQAAARELASSRPDHPFAAAATRRHRALGVVAFWGFLVAIVFSLVTAFGLNFNAVSHAGWASWARIGVGATLIAEGLLLASDWQGARRLVLRRLYERLYGVQEGRQPRLRVWLWRPAALVFTIVGCVWVGVGAFETAQGIRSLV
jgi:hypothetical protein